MANDKLGRPSKERKAMLRGQVSSLLWNGKIETTLAKAKSTARQAEKILTLAINTYQDTVKVEKEIKGETLHYLHYSPRYKDGYAKQKQGAHQNSHKRTA